MWCPSSRWRHLSHATHHLPPFTLHPSPGQVWKYLFPDLVAERVALEHQTGDVTDFFVELVVEWEGEEEELGAMVHICRWS